MVNIGDDIDRMLESQATQAFGGNRGYGNGNRERRRERSRSRDRDRGRRRERRRQDYESAKEQLREREQRTVFAAQIHPKNEERQIFDFFSEVGKVVDIHLTRDSRTLKSKGLAYIEFEDRRSVPHALALSGRKLNGYPVLVQMTQSNRDYATNSGPAISVATQDKPKTLHVKNLHKKLSEDDIRPIFNAFGEVRHVDVVEGPMANEAYVEFRKGNEANTAMIQLNGLEVVGLQISVSVASDANVQAQKAQKAGRTARFEDESGNGGVAMSLQDKHSLMNNLAKRAGLVVPEQKPFNPFNQSQSSSQNQTQQPTRCVLLQNMFDPNQETDPDFDLDIREDVREEVSTHGRLLHIYVDKSSKEGRVYLKFESPSVAASAFKALNGRWFAQQRIVAQYLLEKEYSTQFPGV